MSVQRTQPPIGHVHLVLYPCQPRPPNSQPENEFYLEIPVSFIQKHFRSHLKFLSYLGWCILGIHGDLLNDQHQQVDLGGQLLECGTYYYRTKETVGIFKYAVDLEVIKARSQYNSSESSQRDGNFRKDLLQRDVVCVFTGAKYPVTGIHIIPHSKGDEWIQHIVTNRPNDEPAPDISIDDIQNGLICIPQIHICFDDKLAFILKTPNAVLNENDVEPRCQRQWPLPEGHSYPTNSRYTFQHIDTPVDAASQMFMPDNNDATFLTSSTLRKPSGLLLNYNYGATAVKRWGRNLSIISDRPGAFRPKVSAPAMGPSKTSGRDNRENSAKKRRFRETGGEGGGEGEGAQAGASGDQMQEAVQEWDEDDVMLFFWGNTKIARDRHRGEQQIRKTHIENWRSSVAADSSY